MLTGRMRGAIPARTSRRWFPEPDPAPLADSLERVFETIPLGPGGGVVGPVHTVKMLRKQVFAVGVVSTTSAPRLLCIS